MTTVDAAGNNRELGTSKASDILLAHGRDAQGNHKRRRSRFANLVVLLVRKRTWCLGRAVEHDCRDSMCKIPANFQAGESLQGAAEALRFGDIHRARQLLAERRELLVAASTLWRDSSLRDDAALLGRYEMILDRAYPSWHDGDRRTLLLAMNHFADRRMR